MEIATRKSRLSQPSTTPQNKSSSKTSTIDGDDDDDSMIDFPSPSKITATSSTKKGKAPASRDSLSSVSSVNNEGSDYSTPYTSGLVTPALLPKSISSTTQKDPSAPGAMLPKSVSSLARAKALRNSQYSLAPSGSKRKRDLSDDDDDDDDENTADAQLARALQEQEDALADSMVGSRDSGFRRTSRKAKKIMPKIDFGVALSDDDDFGLNARSIAKRPKVELSKVSNALKFDAPKGKKTTMDSDDDSESFVEMDDSDDDAPFSLSASSSRGKQVAKPHPAKASLKGFKAPKAPTRNSTSKPARTSLLRKDTLASTTSSAGGTAESTEQDSDFDTSEDSMIGTDTSDEDIMGAVNGVRAPRSAAEARQMINVLEERSSRRGRLERARLELHHPELHTMWQDLENLPKIGDVKIEQPENITRELKPFQLEGVAWMRAMEDTEWGGGLLGDEMGMGKTIQAVSLIMSDFPAKQPSLVLIPPVALMQWQQEIADYTDGTLKTFVYHGSNAKSKSMTTKDLRKYNVILMSYNSLESMYRKQEKGFKRKDGIYSEKSVIHQIKFHRVILDEAHNIKVSPLE